MDRGVLEAAPLLLGATITTRFDGEVVSIRTEEVEAYGGSDDPASHAFNGRTARNGPMFEEPGSLYVYLSYGIHWCMNFTAGPPGVPSAVLIRGGSVVDGVDTARRRRGRDDHLADGPGKLCQALAVTGVLTGTPPDGDLVCVRFRDQGPVAFEETPRIGVSKGTSRRWRFVASGPW